MALGRGIEPVCLGLGDVGFLAYTYPRGSYPRGEESRQTLRQGSVGGAMPSQFVQRLYSASGDAGLVSPHPPPRPASSKLLSPLGPAARPRDL